MMSRPASSAFTVSASKPGSSRTIRGTAALVGISGKTVTATLSSAVTGDENLTVRYDKPASGAVLKDSSAVELSSFAGRPARNANETTPPRLSYSRVDGNALEVFWNEVLLKDLDAPERGSPPGSAFTVSATKDGSMRTIAGTGTVALSGATATVTLASAVAGGETVTVSYVKPDTNPLRDAAGNEAANFTN